MFPQHMHDFVLDLKDINIKRSHFGEWSGFPCWSRFRQSYITNMIKQF